VLDDRRETDMNFILIVFGAYIYNAGPGSAPDTGASLITLR